MKHNYKSFLFLICFLLAFLNGYTKPFPKTVFNKAEDAYFEDNLVQAAKLYQQVLAAAPAHLKSHLRLGDIFLELKQPDKAIPHLKEGMEKSKRYNKEVQVQLAEAYQLNYDFDLAITQYFSLLNKVKHDARALEGYHKRMTECKAGKMLMAEKSKVNLQNMGAPINSASADHVPVLTNNDSTLIFTSRRPKGGKKVDLYSDEDIFYTTRTSSDWSAPIRFAKPINTSNHDAVLAASTDGKKLYLYRDNESGGDIFVTQKAVNNTWQTPVKLAQPLNSKYYEPSVFISKDGNYAFFSSDRPGGFGGLDLYVSFSGADGVWSEAMNLGSSINSAYDEDAPFLNADNSVLFFSSKGHQSMGGYDVFSSTVNGATWSEAQNLGAPVNSPFDDIFYVQTQDGKSAYIASDRAGGFGGSDIYLVQTEEKAIIANAKDGAYTAMLASDDKGALVIPALTGNNLMPEAINMLSLSGVILDAETGDTLEAEVSLLNQELLQEESNVQTTEASGFDFLIQKSKTYSLLVQKDGYLLKSQLLSFTNNAEPDSMVLPLKLTKSKKDEAVFLSNIGFFPGKVDIKSQSLTELEWLFNYLENNPSISIIITSYTNTDDETNVANQASLNEKRQKALVKYLTSRGIEAGRVKQDNIDFLSSNNKVVNKGLGFIVSQD